MTETSIAHELQHLHFSHGGEYSAQELAKLIEEIRAHKVTDLFMFAHGMSDGHGSCQAHHKAKIEAINKVKERNAGKVIGNRVLGSSALLWDAEGGILSRNLVSGVLQARAHNIADNGMQPILKELRGSFPTLNVHLCGHSTGTIIAARTAWHFRCAPRESIIKSLFILQSILPCQAFRRADGTEGSAFSGPTELRGTDLGIAGPIVVTQASDDSQLKWCHYVRVQQDPIGRVGLALDPSQKHAKVGLDNIGAPLNFSSQKFWTLDIGAAVGDSHGGAVYDHRVAWAHLALAGVVEGFGAIP